MKFVALTTLCLLLPVFAWSAPEVKSREYKLLLKPDLFSHGNAEQVIGQYFAEMATTVQASIGRDVTGQLLLDKVRTIRFYDTAGSCQLDKLGYIFRERIENGHSELTLKFRSADPYIANFEDLSAANTQAKTKLEADFSIKSPQLLHIIYSHSTTTPNTRTVNIMKDLQLHFPGFAKAYKMSDKLPLSLVGQLNLHERVYQGAEIDLGSIDAKVSLSLWYHSTPTATQQPVIAEVSFKYQDNSAEYTKLVVNRAKTALEAMQSMHHWNSTSTVSKTQFVYQYQPDFCN